MTFEQFLQERFELEYVGLDDDMSDRFDDWLGGMDIEVFMDLADLYGQLMYLKGKNAPLLDINKEV